MTDSTTTGAVEGLETAYLALLRMPHGVERFDREFILCDLRDAIASLTGRSSEEVQNDYERRTPPPPAGDVERVALAMYLAAVEQGEAERYPIWLELPEETREKFRERARSALSALPPRVPEGLTFDALRTANLARLPEFKNGRGEPAHSEPDGSDWCLAQWCNAVLGELGEAANIIKKIERGDLTLDEARTNLADEFADVQTYLDILAYRAGVDLGSATVSKWDRVSERVGCDIRLSTAPPPPAPVGWRDIVEAMRERAAQVAETRYADPGWNGHFKQAGCAIASAIRDLPIQASLEDEGSGHRNSSQP